MDIIYDGGSSSVSSSPSAQATTSPQPPSGLQIITNISASISTSGISIINIPKCSSLVLIFNTAFSGSGARLSLSDDNGVTFDSEITDFASPNSTYPYTASSVIITNTNGTGYKVVKYSSISGNSANPFSYGAVNYGSALGPINAIKITTASATYLMATLYGVLAQ